MDFVISINNIQIDNNAFIDGHYDFPVILVKQKKIVDDAYGDTSFLKPLTNVINDLRQLDSAIILKFTLDKTYHLTPGYYVLLLRLLFMLKLLMCMININFVFNFFLFFSDFGFRNNFIYI